jgi:acetyl esterase/lipase
MRSYFCTTLLGLFVTFVAAHAQTPSPATKNPPAVRVEGGAASSTASATPAFEFVSPDVSQTSRDYLAKMRQGSPFGAAGFDLEKLRAGMGARKEPTIAGVKLIPVKIGDISCEWVLAPGADPDIRLLYLHGGGFVSGSGGRYLPLAAHLSAAAKCAVLLPDYRLAPEHPFPAGLDDCVQAHDWIVDHGPFVPVRAKATFIAGDSAGGNLTLATLLALKRRNLALPSAAIPISPCTDFTLASKSLTAVDDPVISGKTMARFRDLYMPAGDPVKGDPRNPLASPVFGDYRGLPPLLIQVGEHEMLLDDAVRVAAKAKADGAQVRLQVWKGMFHVFQSREPLLPEAREAIDDAADFIRANLPRS